MELPDAETCYAASLSRDARFDGRFVMGVTSTGIYCLPSCKVRKPKAANCRFYASPAAAADAGFRPCRRCRPDAAPGSRHRDPTGDVVARILALVETGHVDRHGVAGLAAAVHLSERQLYAVLAAELGTSAQRLARVRRVRTAKQLLEQTALPMADVARAAGFGSLRSFNDTVVADLQLTPSQVRRAAGGGGDKVVISPCTHSEMTTEATLTLPLRFRGPLDAAVLRRVLEAHAIPGVERHDHGATDRVVVAPSGPAVVRVAWDRATADSIPVTLQLASLTDVAPVVAAVRRWLDLDATFELIADAFSDDPRLGPLVARHPGLRLPGALDGAELALTTVLGQQVSLAAARTLSGRLADWLGEPLADGLRTFPSPERIAAQDVDELRARLRITGARAAALVGLARALADGLDVTPAADRAETRAALLALPGIGPWTADYIELRALGNPDVFMPTDLVARRAVGGLSPRALRDLSAPWAPWRGYALMHLWTAASYDPPPPVDGGRAPNHPTIRGEHHG